MIKYPLIYKNYVNCKTIFLNSLKILKILCFFRFLCPLMADCATITIVITEQNTGAKRNMNFFFKCIQRIMDKGLKIKYSNVLV